MSTVAKPKNAVFDQLLSEWNKSHKDLEKIEELIKRLQISLVTDASEFMPTDVADPSFESHFMERKMLEIAALTACLRRDMVMFPVVIAQLKHYYENINPMEKLPYPDMRYEMIGLNLMYLLTQNRLSEFHIELERIPTDIRPENAYISMPIHLEQYLMEGMYNKIFLSKTNMPSQYYPYFMDILLATVRDEIAHCMEKTYKTLSTKEAARLLFFDEKSAENDVLEYGKKKGWKLSAGSFRFAPEKDKSEEHILQSTLMIQQLLDYADQLETIV